MLKNAYYENQLEWGIGTKSIENQEKMVRDTKSTVWRSIVWFFRETEDEQKK